MATKAKDAPDTAQPPSNTRLWDQLGKTDPRHTKAFTRGGGFKGTAMKPMWQNKLLTETFGPCGIGWGVNKPEFQTVPGAGQEVLVFCTVTGWYIDPADDSAEPSYVYGVGGDKVIATFSSGSKSDDEAFKKAYTDAIGNAFKFVGVGADVHMGMFDDSKYVQDLRAEFESNEDTLGKKADELIDLIRTAKSLEQLTSIHDEVKILINEMVLADRGAEGQQLATTYKARRSALAPRPKAVGADASGEDSRSSAEPAGSSNE